MATYNEEQAKEMEMFGFRMINVSAFGDDEPTFAIGSFDNDMESSPMRPMLDRQNKPMEGYQSSRTESNSINHTFDMEKGLSSVEMVTEDDIVGIVGSGALGRDEILNLNKRIQSCESMDDVRALRKEMLSDHCDINLASVNRDACEVCGAMPVVSLYDYCVFERDGITNYRPFSGGPKYYCEKHKREPEEVMPKNIDIERFNLNGH